jgi:hypothetical protein
MLKTKLFVGGHDVMSMKREREERESSPVPRKPGNNNPSSDKKLLSERSDIYRV